MSTQQQSDFNFEDDLPKGVESFSLNWLSKRFGGTTAHWFNLAEKGAFGKAIVDLRTPGSSKSDAPHSSRAAGDVSKFAAGHSGGSRFEPGAKTEKATKTDDQKQ